MIGVVSGVVYGALAGVNASQAVISLANFVQRSKKVIHPNTKTLVKIPKGDVKSLSFKTKKGHRAQDAYMVGLSATECLMFSGAALFHSGILTYPIHAPAAVATAYAAYKSMDQVYNYCEHAGSSFKRKPTRSKT